MFSELAVLFYSIVYFPQFFLIWNDKSSKGISLLTVLLWTQADFLSLAGSIFLLLNPNIVIIEWYHSLTSVFMSMFCLIFSPYTHSIKLKLSIPMTILFFTNIFVCYIFQTRQFGNVLVGEILGWLTSFIYIVGRFPQIYKNWSRKSTEGLSIIMYILTILGNGFYLLSISENSNGDISLYIPWITLILVSLLLDLFVLAQWYKYRNQEQDDDQFIKLDVRVVSLDEDYDDLNSSETDTI